MGSNLGRQYIIYCFCNFVVAKWRCSRVMRIAHELCYTNAKDRVQYDIYIYIFVVDSRMVPIYCRIKLWVYEYVPHIFLHNHAYITDVFS